MKLTSTFPFFARGRLGQTLQSLPALMQGWWPLPALQLVPIRASRRDARDAGRETAGLARRLDQR